MFEDRSKHKTSYDFKKLDAEARTKVEVAEVENKSDAHKKLFGSLKCQSNSDASTNLKQQVKDEILKQKKTESLEELPSSEYLKSFENQVVEDVEEEEAVTKTENVPSSDMDFVKLINEANKVEVDTKAINKELSTTTQKPKKNFSFRIKLIAGVYCILVALFGGWVIGNTINISQTNSYLYETTMQTSQVQRNILDIIGDIQKLDSVSSDPEDDTIIVKIVTEEIEITPEEITNPNAYEQSSNWFDIICKFIATLFGG